MIEDNRAVMLQFKNWKMPSLAFVRDLTPAELKQVMEIRAASKAGRKS